MKISVIKLNLAVCKLDPHANIPTWAIEGKSFFSISKTAEELSIVCDEAYVPNTIKSEKGWKLLKVEGPLAFSMTGILASIAQPLAKAKISIFAISTFDTDYILVKDKDLDGAVQCLKLEGFEIKS